MDRPLDNIAREAMRELLEGMCQRWEQGCSIQDVEPLLNALFELGNACWAQPDADPNVVLRILERATAFDDGDVIYSAIGRLAKQNNRLHKALHMAHDLMHMNVSAGRVKHVTYCLSILEQLRKVMLHC
jgi:hypothetical protein